MKEEERSYVILVTDVMKWTADIRATVFHLNRKGVRAHRQGHCIALTLTLPNAIYYFFHLLANLKCCTHITGDNIAVKRCSVPRVERILRDFGIEIGESETSRDRKETKMVSVDGTESKKIVVRGMQSYMILHTLCVVFHLTSFAISLFVIAPEQIEITTCTCVGFFEEHLKYSLIVQGRYRALMWALKIYGIRGWEFWQGLFLQTSKPKV